MIISNKFKIESDFKPTGDQPEAILSLSKNLTHGVKSQTLWGVTGSGKTFTMANVIEKTQKPTLVIVHNKTLAAQLADEFRSYFPHNAVHYFVSYYDYYQPEAYIPHSDTYIEKDSAINEEIERLRHAATFSLMTRNDVIIVASVSCIYGIGSPEFYRFANFKFIVNEKINRQYFLGKLHELGFERNDIELKRGCYKLKGETLEILPAYANNSIKIEFFGDTVEKITEVNWLTGQKISDLPEFEVFPATHFLTPPEIREKAISQIKSDLQVQIKDFKKSHKLLEAERIEQRTNFDLEMIEETGSCSGIENYSRYFDGRKAGEASSTLIDFFPKDFLMFVDESHMTIPQIQGMYAGDFSRKQKLVDYGFRLPSAYDNRPLRFAEFYKKINQIVYVSATPAEFEQKESTINNEIKSINKSYNAIVKQFIRPTGLLDPKIEIRPTTGQIDNLINEIEKTVAKKERVLVTTLTKKIAEELADFLSERNIKAAYIHSDVPTLERLEILHKLRLGKYDVLIGINLLREGLDLPEVSTVAVLDADKEGFLRSKSALIQTIGRAARHVHGHAIFYADIMTKSIEETVKETSDRRQIQEKHNKDHHISPKSVTKFLSQEEEKTEKQLGEIDEEIAKLPKSEKRRIVANLKIQMETAAQNLQFERAAELRDQIVLIENRK